ncbi:MAG: aspartate-semialdehyde dehydrogenase [bacterium]|nr:aspartate-semialdehyde dehydrogenase [bacterium]
MNLLILGATGAVGVEIVKLLEKFKVNISHLGLYATERSLGKKIKFNNKEIPVQVLKGDDCPYYEYAIFSAGTEASSKWAPFMVGKGITVIDNSSTWRMDDSVPLVVPEINIDDIPESFKKGIIANPNCSTIQLSVPLKILDDNFIIEEVFVATYQSVSGTGAKAINELEDQVRDYVDGNEYQTWVYDQRIFGNVIPKIGEFTETGSSQEEDKMLNEMRKLLHRPDLKLYATTARVPVFRGHSEAVTVRLKKDFSINKIKKVLSSSKAIRLLTDENYPTPINCENKEEIMIGRIRKEKADEHVLSFWVVADNLWKGAALNAVQILQALLKRKVK